MGNCYLYYDTINKFSQIIFKTTHSPLIKFNEWGMSSFDIYLIIIFNLIHTPSLAKAKATPLDRGEYANHV